MSVMGGALCSDCNQPWDNCNCTFRCRQCGKGFPHVKYIEDKTRSVSPCCNGFFDRNPSLKIYEDHNCETNGCYISVEGIFTHKATKQDDHDGGYWDDDTPPDDISRNGD